MCYRPIGRKEGGGGGFEKLLTTIIIIIIIIRYVPVNDFCSFFLIGSQRSSVR